MFSVPTEEIGPKTSFGWMHADPLELTELLVEIKEKFGVAIAEDEWTQIQTAGDLVRYVAKHGN